jgi:general secretion pathway protein A
MYESFYGLKEKPFNLTPDPAFFYFSQTHKNAYSHLKYAVGENKGFVVITGEIGSGKTTLIKYLLKNVGVDVNIGLINNTHLFPKHMLKLICKEFELNVSRIDEVELQEVFYGFLLNEYAHRRRVVLIVDEAQQLTADNLEEIRMLSNLESDKNHLIQIILIGQPGLKDILNQRGLEQFTQRVTVTYHLGRLSTNEAKEYINSRLQTAGAMNGGIFMPDAIDAIYQHSRGIPRVINILCDTALLYGFADGKKEIDAKLVTAIVDDRKKSGIYDVNKEAPAVKETVVSRDDKPVRTEMETRVALIEKQLKIIESQLIKIDQNLEGQLGKIDQGIEIMAKNNGLALEMMKSLKENIKSHTSMARVNEVDNSRKPKKPVKGWRSFFQ